MLIPIPAIIACLLLLSWEPTSAQSTPPTTIVLEKRFNTGTDGFAYADNLFRNANQGSYASGARVATGGFNNTGALQVTLGGVNDTTVSNMSGGWSTTFNLPAPSEVIVSFRFRLTQTPNYESDEFSEALASVDGVLRGYAPSDFLARMSGDGNGGSSPTTGWRIYHFNIGSLTAGSHTLAIGGFNNKKTLANESTEILIDDVIVAATNDPSIAVQAALAGVNIDRFRSTVQTLASFGDRTQGSPSYTQAADWVQQQLEGAGYTVQKHAFTYNGAPRESLYVTKVGKVFPDRMYIISAHLDGRGGGGGADDDASGSSLVLECALALSHPGIETDVSVRFVFWNNEEVGLVGSNAYVSQRNALQGIESPSGSALYPEPSWLGIVQHDMILFDHGLPPQPTQIPGADIDVEYQAASTAAVPSLTLANALRAGNLNHSMNYPAQVGSNMNNTDSRPFQNFTAAVSVRENQRVAEIGQGANPHWHQPTDVYATYSDADFQLGFDAVRMTLGTVARMAGVRLP